MSGGTGITVAPADVFTEVVHEYPDITIVLTLFNCTIAEGVPQLLEHNDLKWITRRKSRYTASALRTRKY